MLISKYKCHYKYIQDDYDSKTEIYLIENNGTKLKKIKNFLNNCFDEINIQKLILLENRNIVTISNDGYNLCFFKKDGLNYKRFFRNLNKYYYIYGLCKLSHNRFCFLSKENENMIFELFNEDFTSKEKILKIQYPIDKRNNNFMFKINDDKVIIIGKYEFVIFNVNYLEIQTIYKVGLILCVQPFNIIYIDDDYNYKYFAIIFLEKGNFYLKIYHILPDSIEESDKFNLAKYSKEFKVITKNTTLLKYYKKYNNNEYKIIETKKDKNNNNNNINNNEDEEEEDTNGYFLRDNDKKEEVFFEINYDLNQNGHVILILNINQSWVEDKPTFLLDVNANKIEFN